MRTLLFLSITVMLFVTCACSRTLRVYKDGHDFSLGSGSTAKYEMLCKLGDLEKILAATNLSAELKDTLFKYNCSAERSRDRVKQIYASMTVEQRKDIKSAFKKYGYTVDYCPT